MGLVCRRCSRPNPPDALYCYYDGLALGNGISTETAPVDASNLPFLSPFVFPSGRASTLPSLSPFVSPPAPPCRNFNELVAAGHELWAEARELLRDGSLAG